MMKPSPSEKIQEILDIEEDNLIRRGHQVIGGLNEKLLEKQKVGEQNLRTIKFLHLKMQDLFAEMAKMPNILDLRAQVQKIEDIEFEMQKAWGFSVDRNFHTWWIRAPHCTCPWMDNADNRGTPHRIINLSCVLHGSLKPSRYTKKKQKNGSYIFVPKK